MLPIDAWTEENAKKLKKAIEAHASVMMDNFSQDLSGETDGEALIRLIMISVREWDDGLKNKNSIKSVAERHNDWLVAMGWNKTNPLEQLALIASEIGEAVNECRSEKPTDKLGSELADIVLRTFGMAEQNGINIQAEIEAKMEINLNRGTRGRLK